MGADVTVIAAVAENGVIGRDGGLPWGSLPEDLNHFREETLGHPVILGRRTYESIVDELGGPLPGRTSVVVSGSSHFKGEGVRTVGSPGSAIGLALRIDDRAYVAGGESIYRALLPLCNRMLITEVPGEYEGDATFPDWNTSSWEEDSRRDGRDGLQFVEYVKAQDEARPFG